MRASIKNATTIKDLDYSSADCQRLVQEYTRLIDKMIKEYDELADENTKLRNALEHNSKLVKGMKSSPISFPFILRKFCSTVRLYGWKNTWIKVRNKMVCRK